ncbi:uncharacterized protein LOC112013406 [Quercus suber]|uniref:uncharacterized protein LOC112013406 n=1 Tax=Quercus suber TaxID=58331 RepID=UPI000CE17AEC|nr:trichohyalin [Quercus suber]XP_023901566.1 trichohyalin [Quercus suber]
MESERPYRTTSTNSSSNSSTTSELFICFTSRLSSSSSMKLSSKSILSPGRTREPSQISLSSSLSRRLRSNGSMKGGQASPMFPTGAKRRGCAFENPEPSSPKVTCIGQVRVKTKKQGKKLRTRSKRRGEASFRRVEQQNTSLNVTQQEVNVQNNSQFQSQQLLQQQQQQQQQQHECSPHRNQRWVHLPVTICEGLRAFGAEFNCFLPCRSSCMREKEEKAERSEGGGNGSSCGAVFARWLVAMQENEAKGGREIELVVGEEESETESVRRKSRREIFEGIEIKEERIEEEDQEEGRVSICIPPKNALLLMRCRSDPVKMAALANRFWESPVHDKDEDEVEDEDKDEDNENVEHEEGEQQQQQQQRDMEERQSKFEVDEVCDSQEHGYPEEKANLVLEEEGGKIVVEENPELQQHPEEQENHEEEKLQVKEELFEEVNQPVPEPELKQEPEALVDPEVFEHNVVLQEIEDVQENEAEAEHEEEDEEEASFSSPTLVSIHSEQESEAQALEEEEEEEEEQDAKVEALAEDEDEEESLSGTPWEDEVTVTHERFEPEEEKEDDPNTHEKEPGMEESKFRESQQRKPERERESSVLPDCLLLMMCEPKLSMEVSKETWVCSTDFIRWLPERPIKKTSGGDGKDPKKTVISTATEDNSKNPAPPTQTAAPHHLLLQPPRSSCSFPAAVAAAAAPGAGVSMATMIEQKLVGAKGYEPFVLTRCKSEPMRSSAKLMPEPCFWKNRKLEPHRPATLGVGATGVGF